MRKRTLPGKKREEKARGRQARKGENKPLGFRVLSHTTDLEFESYGETFEQALENAGIAAFSGMTDISRVRPRTKVSFRIAPRGDKITILYDFLDRLVFLADSKMMFFSKFSVKTLKGGKLLCTAWGEKISEKRHELLYIVKAATYHGMDVSERPDGTVVCRAILDI